MLLHRPLSVWRLLAASQKIFFSPCIQTPIRTFYKRDAMHWSFNSNSFKEILIMKTQSLLATMFLALMASASGAQPVVRDGALADAAGQTVYTFDKDEPNKSYCTGGCLATWPAFVAKAGATPKGDFGLMEANGAMQWTIKGKPLYYYAGDTKPGDRNGDGSGGVWHVVGQKAAPQTTYGGKYSY